jgi:hypothetical protein
MLTKSVRRAIVAVAASSALTIVAMPAAKADTVGVGVQVGPIDASVTITTNAPPNPNDGLDGAFKNSPLNLLQGILCPVVTGAADTTSTIPGVGPLVDQLPGVVCSINVAGYVYRTVYLPPSGPAVVRYTPALAGLPTLIDVDGTGLLPDFVGTLGLNLTLNGVNLGIVRSSSFPANGRVSIEAVAIVPGAADTYVGFGENGTAVGTAKNWNAKVSVLGLSASTTDLGLDIKTTTPPSSLAVLGELFSGPDPDAPTKTYRGLANYTPVPAVFSTELRMSQSRQQVLVNTTPTKLAANVAILTPGRQQIVDATADQLPASIDLVHTSTANTETTTYDADSPITKLTGSYRDKVNGNIVTAAALDAWGVPAHITFQQTAEHTTVGATSGEFDRIQARFAQGGDVGPLDPSTSPFARFHRTTADAFTGSLQLTNLKSVSINQATPYGGELVFSTAPGLFPFTADDDVTSTHLEGSLSNLPADTTVSVDPDAGVVTFDGHGTGIDKISVKATRPTPFFTRVTRLEATLEGLPALETVNVAQTNGSMSATASQPLGTITLLASDGSGAPSFGGSGASYDDTPALYRAFLRLSGLKSVSFQGDPVIGDLQTAQSQFFTVKGNTSGLTFDGTIQNLPAHMTFAMKPGAGGSKIVDFDSHGESITKITANGTGLPAPAGMPNFEAVVENLPSHLTLTLPSGAGNVLFDAHGDHIGRVYAQAWGGSKASIPANQQKVEYVDGQHVAANLLQIGNAEVSTTASPFHIKYDISSSPLDYEYVAADAKFLRGTISNPTPASVDFDSSNKVDVHYRATTDTQIDSITLKTNLAGGYIDADLQNIAPDVKVCFSGTNKACKPSFVPSSILTTTDGDHYNMPPALFDFSLTPTNLSGGLWPNRFELDGTYCFDESDPTTCLNGSNHKKRITISDLKFGKVAVGAGFKEDGCTACTAGRVYGYFDTDNTLISGDVKYFDEGDDGPFVHYHSDGDNGGIEAQNKLLFAKYCIVCLNETNLTTVTGGTFSCVSEPHLDIDIPVFDDLDVLSGSFIHFC